MIVFVLYVLCLISILYTISHCETVSILKFLAYSNIICIWIFNWELNFIQALSFLFMKLIWISSYAVNLALLNTDASGVFILILRGFHFDRQNRIISLQLLVLVNIFLDHHKSLLQLWLRTFFLVLTNGIEIWVVMWIRIRGLNIDVDISLLLLVVIIWSFRSI